MRAPCVLWSACMDWLTIYRQFFAWTFLGNVAVLSAAAAGGWPWAHEHRTQFAAANILISLLVRNEVFLRVVYAAVTRVVTLGTKDGLGTLWAPRMLRNLITNVLLHIGGIHSGCGSAGLAWLIYGATLLIVDRRSFTLATIVFGYTLMTLVAVACLSAIPQLRFVHHNAFEHLHRFSGWLALANMAVFIALLYAGDGLDWHRFLGTYWFWVTLFTAFLVILPWCCVMRVPVVSEISPSKRVALLKLPRYVKPGLYGRISRGFLSEWHVFGSFGEDCSLPHHYMLCSNVGEFTKMLVEQPPAHLYTRLIKFPGFSYCHRMYSSGVAICTGAAIGVFISLFSNRGLTNFSLIWVGSKFEETYGARVVQLLHRGCPSDSLTLHDTHVHGRPDLVRLAADAFHAKRAEVVFCVSNLAGTTSLVRGCRKLGIPAFGPIWDA